MGDMLIKAVKWCLSLRLLSPTLHAEMILGILIVLYYWSATSDSKPQQLQPCINMLCPT